MTIIYISIAITTIAGLWMWYENTHFVRKARKYDRCFYFRDGQRRTGTIIKKGFVKSYVRDVYDMKVRGVVNSYIFPTEYQKS